MNTLLIIALALASPDYDLSWKGFPGSGGTITGDLSITGTLGVTGATTLTGGSTIGEDLVLVCSSCPYLVYTPSQTTDAAGDGLTIHAGHAYGTSKNGGDLLLSGGAGSHEIACDQSIAAGDTITITVDGSSTTLTEGVEINAGLNDNEWCASVCTGINAISGVSCSGTTSPIHPSTDNASSVVSYDFADGGVDGESLVDTKGTDGVVVLPNKSNEWAFKLKGIDTGFKSYSSGQSLLLFVNGSNIGNYTNATFFLNGNLILLSSNKRIYDYNQALNLGKTATTSHSLAAQDDVIVGDDLEVDGNLYADGDIIQSTEKGAAWKREPSVKTVTFAANPGDASKTTSGLCPANATIKGITWRVVTTGTNCASVEIGDGVDADMFATAFGITQGDTGDISDYTDTTRVNVHDAAGFEATVTANGGNCFDLSIRFTCFYEYLTADTAN
jgi:hypothetical protein